MPDPDGIGGASSPVTSYSYDAVGNVLEITDPLGKVTTYTYDDLHRLIEEQQPDPDGAGALGRPTTAYTYDAVGNLLTLTDPVGNTTTWTYDRLSRQLTDTNELGQTRTFVYDAMSNLVERTDRNDRVIEYVYDNLYRNIAENWLDGSSAVLRTLTFEYDAASQLVAAADPTAAYEYTYDKLGRLTSETQDITGLTPLITLARTYDANGNRTQVAATIGSTADYRTQYTFDNLNRVTRITQQDQPGGNQVADKRFDFAYNAAGQTTSLNRYADLAGTESVATTTYSYDGIGRLTSLQHAQGVTALAGYDYTYDAASRITAIDSLLDGLTNYTNDYTGQLIDADHTGQPDEAYDYDENGNRSNYTIDDNNQIASDGTFNYEYDDEGNRTAKVNIATGARTEYTWDHRNRLVLVTEKNSGGTVLSTVDQAYDIFNRWVRSEVDSNGPLSGGESERFFIYDGLQITLQFDGDDASDLSQRYLWSEAIDQLLAAEEPSTSAAPTVVYPLTDHLGTARDLATYDSSTDITSVANHRRYDSFGNLISESNAAVDLLFGFTGRPYDEASDLQNNLHRWYDPVVGQWVSEDPIGFAAGDANTARYVENSPNDLVDPTGLFFSYFQGYVADQVSEVPYLGSTAQFIAGVGKSFDISRGIVEHVGGNVSRARERMQDGESVFYVVPSQSLHSAVSMNPVYGHFYNRYHDYNANRNAGRGRWESFALASLRTSPGNAQAWGLLETAVGQEVGGANDGRELSTRDCGERVGAPIREGILAYGGYRGAVGSNAPPTKVEKPVTPPTRPSLKPASTIAEDAIKARNFPYSQGQNQKFTSPAAPLTPAPRSPITVTGTTPRAYLDEAVAQQGLLSPPASGLKQKWSNGGFDYEVRVHPANPAYGKSGSIYRVARRNQTLNAKGQGTGWEYMDCAGTWHAESTLKPGGPNQPNRNYNAAAAKDTHIQLP